MARSHTIAVAGKGGVGKTTTCGMIIDYLCKAGKGPLLVVDADANSNLNEVLGVEVETTLGDIREEMARAEQTGSVPANMTKADYAEMKFGTALIEEDDYDMLVMGRTQGKGCYCFVNGVLKTQLDKYIGNYNYVIMDNEAGLEHISRGTLPHVDTMLLVSDCSRAGLEARRNEADRQPRARRRTEPRRGGGNKEIRSGSRRRAAAGRSGLRIRLRGQAQLTGSRQRTRQAGAGGHHAQIKFVNLFLR